VSDVKVLLDKLVYGFPLTHDAVWKLTKGEQIEVVTEYNQEVTGFSDGLKGIITYGDNAYYWLWPPGEFQRRGWTVERIERMERVEKPVLYECHITMLGDADQIEQVVNGTDWHFSKIDGDPVLGVGVKCYATKNYKKSEMSLDNCVSTMETVAESIKEQHIEVVRMKVEEIVYDRRL
jgi:hypothetical protein